MNRNCETKYPHAAVYIGPANGPEFLDPVIFRIKKDARNYARRIRRKGMTARVVTRLNMNRSKGMTANEIRTELRSKGWRVLQGRWFHPKRKARLSLREAASLEALLASEELPPV